MAVDILSLMQHGGRLYQAKFGEGEGVTCKVISLLDDLQLDDYHGQEAAHESL